jgi:6-phosphogluconolactonase
MKNIELIPFASADELAASAASTWLDEIESTNRARKPHCVALSGGRITQKFFAATVEQAKKRGVYFERVHFFWADERCVPPTDPESNFKLANELLLTPLKIPTSQIHRIRGEEPPEAAANSASEEIQRIVSNCDGERSRPGCGSTRLASNKYANDEASLAAFEARALPILDLIFLGMGEDGHVASLFPGEMETADSGKVVYRVVNNSPKPPPNRITLGYPAIAAARHVWVLVSGAGKEAAVRESLKPSGKTPLARVIQSCSMTKIYSDIKIG